MGNSFVFMSFCSVTWKHDCVLKTKWLRSLGSHSLTPDCRGVLAGVNQWGTRGWALADGNACLLFRDSAAQGDREPKSWPTPGTLLLPSSSDDVSGISGQGVCSLCPDLCSTQPVHTALPPSPSHYCPANQERDFLALRCFPAVNTSRTLCSL